MATEQDDRLVRRRDELRRIVYGTPGDPPEHVAEELARVEEELAARDGSGRGTTGRADASGPAPATAEALEWEEERAAVRRRPWPRWALAASVALVGAALLIGPVRDLLSPPRGLGVFERAQTDLEQNLADRVAAAARLDPYDPEGLRSLGSVFNYDFWAYREDDRVCLLSQREYFFAWQETCATVDEFRAAPLTRRISSDDIRDGGRPRRLAPGEVVVVSWGAMSLELEWEIESTSQSEPDS